MEDDRRVPGVQLGQMYVTLTLPSGSSGPQKATNGTRSYERGSWPYYLEQEATRGSSCFLCLLLLSLLLLLLLLLFLLRAQTGLRFDLDSLGPKKNVVDLYLPAPTLFLVASGNLLHWRLLEYDLDILSARLRGKVKPSKT